MNSHRASLRFFAFVAIVFAAAIVALASCTFEESPDVAIELAKLNQPDADLLVSDGVPGDGAANDGAFVPLVAPADASPSPAVAARPVTQRVADRSSRRTPNVQPIFGPAPTSPEFVPRSAALWRVEPLLAVGVPRQQDAGFMSRPIIDRPDVPNRVSGLTPDGAGLYVPMSASSALGTCPEGAHGGVLGIVALDGMSRLRLAEPADQIPPNVSAVHYGPGDRVALYHSCGKYNAGVTLARVNPDGDFTDVRPASDQLMNALWMWEPTWYFGRDGAVKVVIPQEGLYPTGSVGDGPATVVVDFETGAVETVWGTEYIAQVAAGPWQRAMATKGSVVTEKHVLRGWVGPADFARSIDGVVAVTGPDGARLLKGERYQYNPAGVAMQMLMTNETNGAAWEPGGHWVAVTGPGGTVAFDLDGRRTRISYAPSSAPHFSPETGTLVVLEERPNGEVFVGYTFQPADPVEGPGIADDAVLSSGGLGSLRIGMTVAEAEETLGVEFAVGLEGSTLSPGQCVNVLSESLQHLWITGKATSADSDAVEVMIIDNRSARFATPSGIRVGMTREKVLATFPDQLVERSGSIDFAPADIDETTTVRFHTNGDQVSSISVGRTDWLEAAEHCGC